MPLSIEPDSHLPVYLQIVEQIRSAIAAGVYRPGEGLPSLRALAMDLKVNPNTVQRAYDEMDRQGLIRSRRGLGMFVAERGACSAVARAEESTLETFKQSITTAKAAGLSQKQIRALFETAFAGTARGAEKRT